MEMKVCKNCDKNLTINNYYKGRNICKKCYIKKVQYGDEPIFFCCRCKKDCVAVINKDGINKLNLVFVGSGRCCKKCESKKIRRCKKCEKEHWATESTLYCSKCRKNYNSNKYISTNQKESNSYGKENMQDM